jgi:hypothetical protein
MSAQPSRLKVMNFLSVVPHCLNARFVEMVYGTSCGR